jgi:hypothetical protein
MKQHRTTRKPEAKPADEPETAGLERYLSASAELSAILQRWDQKS